jgi:hypothetical protein
LCTIRATSAHLFCADNGRPSVDPAQLLDMSLIGDLFGIRAEPARVREIRITVIYRRFIRRSLTDRVIDASTLSLNFRRRFRG